MPGASARYSCIGCRYGTLVLCVGTVWVWRHEEILSRPTVEATDRHSDRPSKRPTVEATDRRSDRPCKRPTVEAVGKAWAAIDSGSSVCTSLPAVLWRLARTLLKLYNCHQIHGFPWRRLFHVSRRVRSMQNVELSLKSVCWTVCNGQTLGGETLQLSSKTGPGVVKT